jgi:hypothetical protein
MAALVGRSRRRHRPARRSALGRRGWVTAVGLALVAGLAVSCAANDRPRGTADQPGTTVTATGGGQTVQGTGYSFRLPTGWRDVTTEAKQNITEKVDVAATGPPAAGGTPHVVVAFDPSRGLALAEHLAATRKEQAEVLQDARHLGRPRRLGLAGAPALVHEYTYVLNGRPSHGRQVVCLRDGRVLFLTFTAGQQTFATDRTALEQMLSSWSWG